MGNKRNTLFTLEGNEQKEGCCERVRERDAAAAAAAHGAILHTRHKLSESKAFILTLLF